MAKPQSGGCAPPELTVYGCRPDAAEAGLMSLPLFSKLGRHS